MKLIKTQAFVFVLALLCAIPLMSSDASAQRRRSTARSSSTTTTTGGFIVENGSLLEATLNRRLTTKTARDGERFTARVTSPGRLRGATLYGRVADVERGGRIKGRSSMTLDFYRIRLANGRSYDFAGAVENIRTVDEENVRVDDEGTVEEGESRGSTTAKRSGIGAGVGAVIGAIAGGGKGAAIGAVVGGGAGAGSVYAQGRDELELEAGTRLTVRASAPR